MNPELKAEDPRPEDVRLSQLVDGELASDEANDVLLAALDDGRARTHLKELLHLRRAAGAWRRQATPAAVNQAPVLALARRPRGTLRTFGFLAAAAVVGGLLVAGGFLLASRGLTGPGASGTAAVAVTPDRMREVGSAFALHESVAGPLLWYASDEQRVEIGPADRAAPREAPVAVILRMSWGTGREAAARDFVIVCRNEVPTTIDMPAAAGGAPGLRVRLVPEIADRQVRVRYAVAMMHDGGDADPMAGLTGHRSLGLGQTPLGQVAAGDKTFRFDAMAWPLAEEIN